MQTQPKSPFAQLNLPLLDPARAALPAGKDRQLVEALIELLSAPPHPAWRQEKAMNPKRTAERLQRGAAVYIRQSTPGQVLHHQESQRRKYALQDHALQLGFQRVVVIDEDLGRSGSGLVERGGFQQLVCGHRRRSLLHRSVAPGTQRSQVASPDRIVRDDGDRDGGPGWHLRSYPDERPPADGAEGRHQRVRAEPMRQRSAEAIRQKAQRGELPFDLPVGGRATGWAIGNLAASGRS